MSGQVADFSFWPLRFDKDGAGDASVDTFLTELPGAGLTHLFIFSHGWNNDEATALDLYSRFFGEMRALLDDGTVKLPATSKVGLAGVFWPSILFPGDTVPTASSSGASDFGGTANAAADLTATLETVLPKAFTQPGQQAILTDLIQLLDQREPSTDKLFEFRDKLTHLMTLPQLPSTQDDLESLTETPKDRWLELLDAAATPDANDDGGTAALPGFFDKMWKGAKNVLRVATYWEMKNRAGVIGQKSLGPLIGEMHAACPELRIHLLGHSFGARLVSYSLKGLPDYLTGTASPVKMLFLLQGAFSHFAFAPALPFDATRSGDLNGMSARVDGPLVATHSRLDTAVGVAYPAASFLAGADATDAGDVMYRWEGMGCDGARAVNAAETPLGAVPYTFHTGAWLNMNGDDIIVAGGPPSGAHSDIVHPETAFVAWSAAGLAK